ncbi:MAG: diguanylate cyclase, partial [Terriglobia bacterium]
RDHHPYSEIPEIKIWSENGTIVYSTESGKIGQQYPISEGLQISLNDEADFRSQGGEAEHESDGRNIEVYVPIHSEANGKVIGAAEIYFDTGRLLMETDRTKTVVWLTLTVSFSLLYLFLYGFASMASGAFVARGELEAANTRLASLVAQDPLTGIGNHRHFEETCEKEFERAKRLNEPFSMIMIDIDYFKSINDVYGHQFGDLLLKQFASHLKEQFRSDDTVARYGGEEFVALMPSTSRLDAAAAAQRMVESVKNGAFGDQDRSVKLKISAGSATFPDDRIADGPALVRLADKVLRKVKEDGGGRAYTSLDVVIDAPPGVDTPEGDENVETLRRKLTSLTERSNQSVVEAISAFAKTLEVKDQYTSDHVEQTVEYAVETAKALDLASADVDSVRQAALLHDLGKIGLSDEILGKAGRLTKVEVDQVKKHPEIAVDIIRPVQSLQDIIPMVLHHHERWDGTGYPQGLEKDEIPLGARIIAVADVYQALTSDRPYRKSFSRRKARQMIKDRAGTHFDPRVVDAFLSVLVADATAGVGRRTA